MRKNRALILGLSCICFLLVCASIARADDADTTVNQVTGELTQAGVVTQQDADAIKAPLKNMIKKGARKQDLKNAVADLSGKGVKGDDLKQSVNSMNDLVNAGETPRDAGNVVSRAAAQARAQGLKGKDLAAKVHEAVRQRKAQKNEAKKNIKKAEKQEKDRLKEKEKEREKAKEKAIEKEREREKERAEEIERQQENKGKAKGKNR